MGCSSSSSKFGPTPLISGKELTGAADTYVKEPEPENDLEKQPADTTEEFVDWWFMPKIPDAKTDEQADNTDDTDEQQQQQQQQQKTEAVVKAPEQEEPKEEGQETGQAKESGLAEAAVKAPEPEVEQPKAVEFKLFFEGAKTDAAEDTWEEPKAELNATHLDGSVVQCSCW
eukprot:TRINITY_DN137_c0_g1_i1.p1 TRINITY_DN137_c0_g1~~TRINITY_DN137_c0_g1_i1.p1  ORF type:complete len:172 (-),score=57.93 TRINITY_DN137_c0_g1_i1:268-783(-)